MPADPKSLPSYEASHEFDKRGHRNYHVPPPAGPPQAPPENLNRHLQPPNNPQFNRGGPPPGLPAPPHAYPGDGPRHGGPGYGGPGGPPHPPPTGPHNVHAPFRAGAPHAMPGPMPFNSMNRPTVPYNGYRPPQPAPLHYNKGHHGHHPGPRNDRWEPRGGHNTNNQSRPPVPLPAHLPPRPVAPLGTTDNDRDRGHYRGGGGHNNRRPDPPSADGGGGGGELPDKPVGAALNYG
ncbi:hypothetical protein BYT27DRAFT_6694247 [Phlegmacium glaucopus]|nr:hypothetical protein BYT27DRAFT_6694247 [Phlegmacium glaucopus]